MRVGFNKKTLRPAIPAVRFGAIFIKFFILSLATSLFVSSSFSSVDSFDSDQVSFEQGATTDVLAYLKAHVIENPIDPSDPSVPKYNRRKHFGGWVHQNSNKPCFGTREDVLSRDADPSVPIEFKSPKSCIVKSGLWHDPYTGNDYTQAVDIQIDHVVPLRNAYYAGAHRWAPEKRCNYSNFIGNEIHLMAVNGHENMKKGDHGPENYLPPDHVYRCEYLSNWMRIKTVWQLTVTRAEFESINTELQAKKCPSKITQVSSEWIKKQRDLAAKPVSACDNFGRNPLQDDLGIKQDSIQKND